MKIYEAKMRETDKPKEARTIIRHPDFVINS